MRILLVSCTWPTTAAQSSHGIFKRLDALAEGALQVATTMEAIFYVSSDQVRDCTDAEASRAVSLRWGRPVDVHLEAREEVGAGGAFWRRWIAPALSFRAQHPYSETAGAGQVGALAAALSRRPDLLLVHRLRSMPPVFAVRGPLPPIVFDLDDMEHVSLERTLREPPHWKSKRFLFWQLPALKQAERRAVTLAAATLVCSDADARLARDDLGGGRYEVIPNSVELPALQGVGGGPVIVTIGQFSYAPNRSGIERFIEEVWPLVRQQRPDARLLVVGPNAHAISHHSMPPAGVTFAGFVSDLASVYSQARAVLCPIYAGSGTRVKLVEAAAYSKAIVSTPLGAEGLGFVDGEHALLRETARDLADACLLLLQDRDFAAMLGRRAREHAEQHFDRRAVVRRIGAVIGAAAAAR